MKSHNDPELCMFVSEDPIGFDGGDVNLYAYCSSNPIMFVDPEGLWALQLAGAIIGGAANAYSNFSAYSSGAMSGWGYAQSIVFGAGTGALASFAPGIISGSLAGGASASANNINNQMFMRDNISWSEVGDSFVAGSITGFVGGVGSKIGCNFVNIGRNTPRSLPSSHPYSATGRSLPAITYGGHGAIAGNFVGTVSTSWK